MVLATRAVLLVIVWVVKRCTSLASEPNRRLLLTVLAAPEGRGVADLDGLPALDGGGQGLQGDQPAADA